MRKAIVIGAGLGGMAAAVRLRTQGFDVRILEQTGAVGGKCGFYEEGGFRFDIGPSVLTLPAVLRDLFEVAGEQMEDHLRLLPVEPGCRYFFPDGMCWDAPGTLEGFRAAIAESFPAELAGFDRFARYTQTLWDISGPVFLNNPLRLKSLGQVSWVRLMRGSMALMPVSMNRAVRHFFKDPRLIQLFNRYATYNGSDPFRTPATFNVISHVELAFGSWRCEGGMYALAEALAGLCDRLGVGIELNTPVDKIAFAHCGDGLEGVVLRDGKTLAADAVVVNADGVSALTGNLFSDHPDQPKWVRRYAKTETSGSGFVVLVAVKHDRADVAAHNVFFSSDYPAEFRDQFEMPGRPLRDPTVYLHVMHGRPDRPAAPAGKQSWFLLVNAPGLDRFDDWTKVQEAYASSILATVGKAQVGFQPSDVEWHRATSPHFYRENFGAWRGSLYGPASNRALSAFFRVRNRPFKKLPLAFAGGSAHPGGGIPLVLLSGMHAADALTE